MIKWQFVLLCLWIQGSGIMGRHLSLQDKRNLLNKLPHLNMVGTKLARKNKTGSFTFSDGDVTGRGQYDIHQEKVNVDINLSIKNAGSPAEAVLIGGDEKPTSLSTPTTNKVKSTSSPTLSLSSTSKPTTIKDVTSSLTLASSSRIETSTIGDATSSPTLPSSSSSKTTTIKDVTSSSTLASSSRIETSTIGDATSSPTLPSSSTSKTTTIKDATSSPTLASSSRSETSTRKDPTFSPTLITTSRSKEATSTDVTTSSTTSALPDVAFRTSTALTRPTRKGSKSRDVTSPTKIPTTTATSSPTKDISLHINSAPSGTKTNAHKDGSQLITEDKPPPIEDQIQYTVPSKVLLHGFHGQTELTKLKKSLANAAANWALNLRNGIHPRKYENQRIELQRFYNRYHNYLPNYNASLRKQWYRSIYNHQ